MLAISFGNIRLEISRQRWKSLLTTMLAGCMKMHLQIKAGYWAVTGRRPDQGKLITSWGSAQVNHPALYDENQGPILELFSWNEADCLSFHFFWGWQIWLQNRNPRDAALLAHLCGQLPVCLSNSFFPCLYSPPRVWFLFHTHYNIFYNTFSI